MHFQFSRLRLFALGLIAFGMVAHLNAQDAKTSPSVTGFPKANRIVFLGDSITHAGGYVALLETATLEQHPAKKVEFLNIGLSSETVSGLSEPGHAGGQFPRPDLHERLKRVLDGAKPDFVVACYGMNDGIYYPLSDERFEKFKSGMIRLHEAVLASGADILHVTPAVFDALPIRAKVLPDGLAAYPTPFEGYDSVLSAYSEWLVSKRADGWKVVDMHSAMKEAIAAERKKDPNFTFSRDGVHPNEAGQAIIAAPIASAWGLKLEPPTGMSAESHEKILKLVREKQNALKLAWLTHTKHTRPGVPAGMPLDKAQEKANELDRQIRDLIAQAQK